MQNSDQNSVYSQPLFGHPMLLAVPRHLCTYEKLYQLLLQRMSRYVKVPDDLDDWQEELSGDGDDELSLSDNALSDNANGSSVGASNGTSEGDGRGGEASNGHDDSALQMDTMMCQGEGQNITNNKNDTDAVASCWTSLPLPRSKRIFIVKATNSFGRDDAETVLVDDGKPLGLTNRNYIVVDWSKAARDRFFDEKAAEEFEEHDSMKSCYAQKRSVFQLDDCLKLFMKEEQLSERYCPDCKEHKQATKKFDLWSLPDILIIHLKRFSYNKYWRDKIDVLVEFPLQGLDLRKYIINEESTECDVFDLIAVTNHYGGLGGGHYTAYAKNKDDGNWYNFDDSSVTSSSADSVVTKAAYVLVYQRRSLSESRQPVQSGKSHTSRTSLTNTNNSHDIDSLESSIPNGVGAASEDDEMEVN